MPNLISAQEPVQPAQQPSIGRIVHYVSYGTPGGEYSSTCRAAVITFVHAEVPHELEQFGPYVDVAVLTPTGLFFNYFTAYDDNDDDTAPATWHWPERV